MSEIIGKEIAKNIKWDGRIIDLTPEHCRDFIEADLSRVISEIEKAKREARREVANQLIDDIGVRGGPGIMLTEDGVIVRNALDAVISANSEKEE